MNTIYFKKIYADDPVFIETKENYHTFYEEFQQHAEDLTILSGRAKGNKSGKAAAYARYLISLFIIYKGIFGKEIGNPYLFSNYQKLMELKAMPQFKEYNKKNNHFPSATLSCYLSFLSQQNEEDEHKADIELNNTLDKLKNTNADESENLSGPKKKKNKMTRTNRIHYPRDIQEALQAKKNAQWKCEYDSEHITFTNLADGKPYVEAHHLIPMSAQDYFDNSIDFAANIIALCPNCHSKIHFAKNNERKELIKYLFSKRHSKYERYGVNLDERTLFSFYHIF